MNLLVFSILLVASPFASAAGEPAICENAYQTICSAPEVKSDASQRTALLERFSVEAIDEAVLPKAQGGCGIKITTDPIYAYDHGNPEALKRDSVLLESNSHQMACYGTLLQQKVLAYSHSTLADTQKVMDAMRADMVLLLKTSPGISESTRAQMISAVQAIRYYSIEDIFDIASFSDDADSIFSACGDDLTAENAYSIDSVKSKTLAKDAAGTETSVQMTVSDHHGVVLCPANFLTLLPVSDPHRLAALYHRLAHEMGLQIDVLQKSEFEPVIYPENVFENGVKKTIDVKYSCVGTDGNSLPVSANYDFLPLYTKFISCLEEHYSDEMTYGIEAEGVNGDIIADEIALRFGHPMTCTPENAKNNRDCVDMHTPELSGDYWGTKYLESILAQGGLSQTDQMAILRQAMRNLCVGDPDKDYGIHPSMRLRVDMILKDPALRKAMGCSAVQNAQKPFCGLSGDEL